MIAIGISQSFSDVVGGRGPEVAWFRIVSKKQTRNSVDAAQEDRGRAAGFLL